MDKIKFQFRNTPLITVKSLSFAQVHPYFGLIIIAAVLTVFKHIRY